MNNKIKEFQGEYRWLSNFWPVEIEYKGRFFSNVENAFHSEKSNDEKFKDFCASESDPKIVKKAQREMVELREDWEEVKENIMEDLVRIKFQNLEMKEKLLNTGDMEIEEGNTWGDTFWGVDLETGEGKNRMGKIIMKIRDEVKNNS